MTFLMCVILLVFVAVLMFVAVLVLAVLVFVTLPRLNPLGKFPGSNFWEDTTI